MNMFKDITLTNQEASTSDHYPLFLELYRVCHEVRTRQFRFENAWLHEPMCQQSVIDVWQKNEEHSFYIGD